MKNNLFFLVLLCSIIACKDPDLPENNTQIKPDTTVIIKPDTLKIVQPKDTIIYKAWPKDSVYWQVDSTAWAADYNCTEAITITDEYIYPYRFGTPSLLSIPDSIVVKMSANGLIKSIFNHPYFNHLGNRNSFNSGLATFREINAYTELIKRDDAGTACINFYKYYNPYLTNCKIYFNEKVIIESFNYYQLLCAQEDILSKLSHEQKKEFMKIILGKYNLTFKYPHANINDYEVPLRILFLINKLMISANYKPYINAISKNQDLNNFNIRGNSLGSPSLAPEYHYKIMFDLAKQFLNQ
jgi:hypothetical protein